MRHDCFFALSISNNIQYPATVTSGTSSFFSDTHIIYTFLGTVEQTVSSNTDTDTGISLPSLLPGIIPESQLPVDMEPLNVDTEHLKLAKPTLSEPAYTGTYCKTPCKMPNSKCNIKILPKYCTLCKNLPMHFS